MELSQRAARLTDKRAEEADTSRIAAKSRGSERWVPYLGGLAALLQGKAALVGNQGHLHSSCGRAAADFKGHRRGAEAALMRKRLPNLLTAARFPLAFGMLEAKGSVPFLILYLLCCLTDMLDGLTAVG